MHRDASCYAAKMTEPRSILTVRMSRELRDRIETFARLTHRSLNDAAVVALERALASWETDPYYAPERNHPHAPVPVPRSQESAS
jgi:hypothetical protein